MDLTEERMLILQMVADKKISANEAAELLKALEPADRVGARRVDDDDVDDDDDDLPSVHRTAIREAEEGVRRAAHELKEHARQISREARDEARRAAREAREHARLAAHEARRVAHEAREEARRAAREQDQEFRFSSLIGRLVDSFSFDFGDEGKIAFEDTHEGTFTAEQPALTLKTGNGKLHLHGWDEPGYKVILQYRVRGAKDEAEAREIAKEKIHFEATGDGVQLDVRERMGFDRTVGVGVEVWLPKGLSYRLDGRTGNGSLRLEGLSLTDAVATSGNGSIKVLEARAEQLKASTGNGSLEVEGDIAQFEGSTGNGSLRVRPAGVRSQVIKVATGNGSVKVNLSEVPEAAGWRVDATTGMGGVKVDSGGVVFEKQFKTIGNKHYIVRSQNYGESAVRVDVKANTGLGSITVD